MCVAFSGTRNIEYRQPTKYLEDPYAVRSSKLIYLNGGFKLGVNLFRGVRLEQEGQQLHPEADRGGGRPGHSGARRVVGRLPGAPSQLRVGLRRGDRRVLGVGGLDVRTGVGRAWGAADAHASCVARLRRCERSLRGRTLEL